MLFKVFGNWGSFLKTVHLQEKSKKQDSNDRRVSLNSVPVTIMGTVFMEAISKQKTKKLFRKQLT